MVTLALLRQQGASPSMSNMHSKIKNWELSDPANTGSVVANRANSRHSELRLANYKLFASRLSGEFRTKVRTRTRTEGQL